MFNIFGSLAQFERDLIRERTRAGLAAALARGRKGGRPAKLDEKQVREVRRLYESKSVTVNQIAAMMNVGRSTIYSVMLVKIRYCTWKIITSSDHVFG